MRYFCHAALQFPLLLVLLIYCAGGCLASVVTYPCGFDKVRRAHGAGWGTVVVQNLPAKEGGGSTTFSVFRKEDWQPIRIEVSTKDVEDTTKHCVIRADYKPNFLGGNSLCTPEDKITTEKQETLIKKVIPAAVKLHTDRLFVKSPSSRLVVPEFTKGSVCSNFFVPSEHRVIGVDADMMIYVGAAPGGVWALPCAALADGRPVVGVMNFAPAELMYVRLATRIAAHLIAHALGFDHRTMAGRNMVAGVTGLVRGRRLAVVVNSTNTVMNAKEHYDCNEIYGMELQDMEGDGKKLESHWSRRNAKDELMAPLGGGGYYTALTMAAFADLGFYRVNWEMAEPMSWGNKSGCELLEKRCDELGFERYPKMFCNGADHTARCTSDRYFNGDCTGRITEKLLRTGTDVCTIVEGVKEVVEEDHVVGHHRYLNRGERDERRKWGDRGSRSRRAERTSWCVDAAVTLSTSQHDNEDHEKKVAGLMVNVTCAKHRVRLFPKGIRDWESCNESDTRFCVLRNYGSGTVVCPKYEEVCTIFANGSSRLPLISWDGEEKVYDSKYTRGPLPIPQGSSTTLYEGNNEFVTEDLARNQENGPLSRKDMRHLGTEERHAGLQNNPTDATHVTHRGYKNSATEPNGATTHTSTSSGAGSTPLPYGTTPLTEIDLLNIRSGTGMRKGNGGRDGTVRERVSAVLLLLFLFWGVALW